MKKLLFLIIMSAFTVFAKAQNHSRSGLVRLDSNTVIKDSAGEVIPYRQWQPLMASGEYALRSARPPGDGDPGYVIYKLTVEQKESRMSNMGKPRESEFFKTGETIASFAADDINGKGFKLKNLKGKIVVLNFWFIGCPPCRMEIPELNKIALAYANDPNVIFISFGLDDRYDIKNYIKLNPFAYHIVDNGRMYADLYRIHLYPTNLVLDKEGKVRFHSSGYSPNLPYWIKKTINECK